MKEVTIRRVNELREISQEIALFKNREKFIKVEFESFTDEENQSIEGSSKALFYMWMFIRPGDRNYNSPCIFNINDDRDSFYL